MLMHQIPNNSENVNSFKMSLENETSLKEKTSKIENKKDYWLLNDK